MMKDGAWTLIGKPGSARGIIDVLVCVSSFLGHLEIFRFFHNARSHSSGSIKNEKIGNRQDNIERIPYHVLELRHVAGRKRAMED